MPAGLLGIEDLPREEIEAILNRAGDFQPHQHHEFLHADTLRVATSGHYWLIPGTQICCVSQWPLGA